MEKRQVPFYRYRLKVDHRGRLKLPPEVEKALGETRDVAIISDSKKKLRIYPLGATVRRRTVFGRSPAQAGKTNTTWASLAFVADKPHAPLEFEPCMSCFVTTVDAGGRVVVGPVPSGRRSEVELEIEEVYLEWHRDHFLVTTNLQ